MKLWSGRFKEKTDAFVEEFTASIQYDKRLYKYDIQGSIAHAGMLGKTGVIAPEEAKSIQEGLRAVLEDIEDGRFEFKSSDEDIHMAVERALTERIGPVGGKLHTARSRNDQVATDTRLFLRDAMTETAAAVLALQRAIAEAALGNIDAVMPGYTHLQRAQPVLFSHHIMAYFWMLARDFERLQGCLARTNKLPLGAAALAGTVHPIDREAVAAELGFDGVIENSIDAVSDRDFIVDYLASCSLISIHLSRLAEEIILWNSSEFGFVELSDSFTTGSSIMPQKKNPDVAELIRGKSGRVVGDLVAVLTLMKGLPLAYNRDMQEDKEPLFDAVDTILGCLKGASGIVSTMTVNKEAMLSAVLEGFANATDLADYLVGKGVPFRQAHQEAGQAVALCIEKGVGLTELSLDEFKSVDPAIEEDVFKALSIDESLNRRASAGGTAPARVKEQLEQAKKVMAAEEAWLSSI
ncbi:MAG: argininosuccinate lyase [Candidatus Aquicultorales bacterium]